MRGFIVEFYTWSLFVNPFLLIFVINLVIFVSRINSLIPTIIMLY